MEQPVTVHRVTEGERLIELASLQATIIHSRVRGKKSEGTGEGLHLRVVIRARSLPVVLAEPRPAPGVAVNHVLGQGLAPKRVLCGGDPTHTQLSTWQFGRRARILVCQGRLYACGGGAILQNIPRTAAPIASPQTLFSSPASQPGSLSPRAGWPRRL